MSTVRLTTASYVVLGLIEICQPATAYDLKRLSAQSVVNFWSLPHTQLYSETSRLAKAGMLHEEREESGRRRRLYTLSEDGRAALDSWRNAPTRDQVEVRDPATLKLFFGADANRLATEQIAVHEQRLAEYEQTGKQLGTDAPRGMRLALECGMAFEQHLLRFWHSVAEGGTGALPPGDQRAE